MNPIAGMGGSVGLKGTDGENALREAIALGAKPQAGARARRALAILGRSCPAANIFTGKGKSGTQPVATAGLHLESVSAHGASGRHATYGLARRMAGAGVGLIAFAGGDGTARDILKAVGGSVPLLGIPCGVKMHSGVFALDPEAAGRILVEFVQNGFQYLKCREVEIADVDEAGLRAGRLNSRLYGYANALYHPKYLQLAKAPRKLDDDAELERLGHEIADEMESGKTYLIGPGTTAKWPLRALGIMTNPLGVDVLRDRHLISGHDGGAKVLRISAETELSIIVGVIGGHGFIFGRGNQQIGSDAIRRAWPDDVTIISGAAKLAALPHGCLHADTGDPALDESVKGYVRVRTGPRRKAIIKVV